VEAAAAVAAVSARRSDRRSAAPVKAAAAPAVKALFVSSIPALVFDASANGARCFFSRFSFADGKEIFSQLARACGRERQREEVKTKRLRTKSLFQNRWDRKRKREKE